MIIDRQYIVDNKNRKLAVQIDIETFKKIEEVLENYALYKLMNEDNDDVLSVSEAKTFYESLNKNNESSI